MDEDDRIDLPEIISTIFSSKRLIAVCALLSAIAAYLYVQGQDLIYEANALIQIEQKRGSSFDVFSDVSSAFDSDNQVATEIEILKSRFVLGEVVDRRALQIHQAPKQLLMARYAPALNDYLINLNQTYIDVSAYNESDARIVLGDIDLPALSYPVHLVLKVTSPDTYDVFDEFGHWLYSGTVGFVPDTDEPIKVVVQTMDARLGAEFNVSFTHRLSEISALRERLKIQEKGGNTGVLELVLESANQAKVCDILNEIISVYAEQNAQWVSEEAQRSIDFLDQQVPKVKQELALAEDAVNAYRADSSKADMRIETETILKKIVAVESRLNELQLKENEISGRYKKDHPTYVTLLKQRNSLLKEKASVNQQIQKLPVTQQELLGLMRNVEVASAVYVQLLNKREELKVARAGTIGDVRILDPAEVMLAPIKPRKAQIMLFTVFIGVFLGIVLAFVRAWLRMGLTNPVEVQDKLGLANYGVIPTSAGQQKIDKHLLESENQLDILCVADSLDPALEAVRSIRTGLHFAMLEAQNNIVALTSANPAAGKSFVSSNLAALIAQSGQNVLLVDIDMRRGHIHTALHQDRAPGLSNLLSEGLEPTQVIHKGIIPNLDFISTGDIPPNPSELLMSKAYTDFITQIQQHYAIVIMDTPPILAVTDAALIARQAGTCLLVVRHDANSLREVQQAQQELDNLGVTLKGYIYNAYKRISSRRYSYNYNAYYSYNYSHKSEKETSKWSMQTITRAFGRLLKKRSSH